MPSTFVHVGFAVLVGAALLSDHFDSRALGVVIVMAVIPDLDTFLGFVYPGGHRALLHNLVVPSVLLLVFFWDTRFRESSYVLGRWGGYGYRVIWVGLVAGFYLQVLLDAFYNGANLFWPLWDSFYDLSGHLWISDQTGVDQTFLNIEWGDYWFFVSEEDKIGTTTDTHYYTAVDPGPDAPSDVERKVPIAESGELLLLAVTGYLVAGYRLFEVRSGSGD